ncbi:hypothetical protein K7X08_035727 [Anisodus acutangulus]|uniref:Uncharacterized protein n=1 Tax=Anisodus acutangulus TaxID=402998 RepID=A0A9Q1RI06_9SOLA|nr:hypothetical protein K7X08_035727 [Anisodus acutangulus]
MVAANPTSNYVQTVSNVKESTLTIAYDPIPMKKVTYTEDIPYVKWSLTEVSRMKVIKEQMNDIQNVSTSENHSIVVPAETRNEGSLISVEKENVSAADLDEIVNDIQKGTNDLIEIDVEKNKDECNNVETDDVSASILLILKRKLLVEVCQILLLMLVIRVVVWNSMMKVFSHQDSLVKRDNDEVRPPVDVHFQASGTTDNIPSSSDGNENVMSNNERVISEDLSSDRNSNTNMEEE